MIYKNIYEKLWKFIKLMISKIFMKSYENLWKVMKIYKTYD
jgi:hypothetical protein